MELLTLIANRSQHVHKNHKILRGTEYPDRQAVFSLANSTNKDF